MLNMEEKLRRMHRRTKGLFVCDNHHEDICLTSIFCPLCNVMEVLKERDDEIFRLETKLEKYEANSNQAKETTV